MNHEKIVGKGIPLQSNPALMVINKIKTGNL